MSLTAKQIEYREVYLRSGHWRQIRELALRDFEYRCAVCYSAKDLDVHHRTYERLGNERLGDLTVLCRGCHSLFHEKGKVKEPRKKKLATEKQIAYIMRLGGTPTEGMTMREARNLTTQLQRRANKKAAAPKTLRDLTSRKAA